MEWCIQSLSPVFRKYKIILEQTERKQSKGMKILSHEEQRTAPYASQRNCQLLSVHTMGDNHCSEKRTV